MLAVVALAIVTSACRSDRPPQKASLATPVASATPFARPSARPPAAPPRSPAAESLAPPSPNAAPLHELSRREARELVGRFARERLDRELTADERERLADAVLRLRASARALRATDDSPAGVAERRARQEEMRAALDDIARITGIPPSDLGTAFDPSEASP